MSKWLSAFMNEEGILQLFYKVCSYQMLPHGDAVDRNTEMLKLLPEYKRCDCGFSSQRDTGRDGRA